MSHPAVSEEKLGIGFSLCPLVIDQLAVQLLDLVVTRSIVLLSSGFPDGSKADRTSSHKTGQMGAIHIIGQKKQLGINASDRNINQRVPLCLYRKAQGILTA